MAPPAPTWAEDVLGYWFGLTPAQWFRSAELDAEIGDRFLELWEAQRQCPVDAFMATPRTALAAVILFDQLPRNMFRDRAESFATDHLGLAVAKAAIDRGYDDHMSKDERTFLYMPFQHSEQLADQRRALVLFASLDDPELARFAQLHHDVIARFGRFPHRNAMLGRAPRAEETAAGDVTPW